MDAKLSSVRMMSAASLATSVPAMPMATPMSAFFSAGASFTPSPVTATTSPSSLSRLTTRNFCSGATRAKMTSPFRAVSSSASVSASSSTPEMTRGWLPRTIPMRLAIDSAVSP